MSTVSKATHLAQTRAKHLRGRDASVHVKHADWIGDQKLGTFGPAGPAGPAVSLVTGEVLKATKRPNYPARPHEKRWSKKKKRWLKPWE